MFMVEQVRCGELDRRGAGSRGELGSATVPAILKNKGESMRKSLLVFAAAALLASLSASGQNRNASNVRYRWHDGQGLLHFSDSLSVDAMKYGYDIVNDQGLTIRRVPRQLTAEERVVANKLAAEQAAKDRAAKEIADNEGQMMAAYPDEASFKISQQQALDTIDQQMHTTQINLRSQEKALTELLGRAADLERAKDPVPKFMADRITEQRNVVNNQRNVLARQQAGRDRTVQLQVTQLARYRQLKIAQDQQDQPGR